jgi:hypothetical protein
MDDDDVLCFFVGLVVCFAVTKFIRLPKNGFGGIST